MAGYTIYDLLTHLVNQAAWKSEGERAVALASIEEYRQVNLFGQMATVIECDHPPREWIPRGIGRVECNRCHRTLECVDGQIRVAKRDREHW
jgi:hypothetical protein